MGKYLQHVFRSTTQGVCDSTLIWCFCDPETSSTALRREAEPVQHQKTFPDSFLAAVEAGLHLQTHDD